MLFKIFIWPEPFVKKIRKNSLKIKTNYLQNEFHTGQLFLKLKKTVIYFIRTNIGYYYYHTDVKFNFYANFTSWFL